MKNSNWQWIQKRDRLLLYLTFFCLSLLLVSQIILLFQAGRVQLSRIDQLEGEQLSLDIPPGYNEPIKIIDSQNVTNPLQLFRNSQVIIIRMITPVNHHGVFAAINGKKAEDFYKGEVQLHVYDGDYVEINATALQQPSQYIVNVPGSKVVSPLNGLIVESRGTITAVGKVKFKN